MLEDVFSAIVPRQEEMRLKGGCAEQASQPAALCFHPSLLQPCHPADLAPECGSLVQVGDVQDQQQAARAELERMAATVTEKERENAKLWEQMRTAASEYHQEFVAKEATIGALIAESETTKQRMQADIDKLRAAMEVRPPLSAWEPDSALNPAPCCLYSCQLLSAFEIVSQSEISAIHMC